MLCRRGLGSSRDSRPAGKPDIGGQLRFVEGQTRITFANDLQGAEIDSRRTALPVLASLSKVYLQIDHRRVSLCNLVNTPLFLARVGLC